MYYLKI